MARACGSSQLYRAQRDAGYTIFETDLAQLQVLQRNYQRHLNDENVIPGRNVIHHANGPLSERSRQALSHLRR